MCAQRSHGANDAHCTQQGAGGSEDTSLHRFKVTLRTFERLLRQSMKAESLQSIIKMAAVQ